MTSPATSSGTETVETGALLPSEDNEMGTCIKTPDNICNTVKDGHDDDYHCVELREVIPGTCSCGGVYAKEDRQSPFSSRTSSDFSLIARRSHGYRFCCSKLMWMNCATSFAVSSLVMCLGFALLVYLTGVSPGTSPALPVIESTTHEPASGQSMKNGPMLAAVRAQEQRSEEQGSEASRAHLYLNVTNLNWTGQLRWTDADENAYRSSDLGVTDFRGKFGCLSFSRSGFYVVYSKVTFSFSDKTVDQSEIISHNVVLVRGNHGNGGSTKRSMILKNVFTTPSARNLETLNYVPSDLHRPLYLRAGDQLCVTVSHTNLIYLSQKDNHFGVHPAL